MGKARQIKHRAWGCRALSSQYVASQLPLLFMPTTPCAKSYMPILFRLLPPCHSADVSEDCVRAYGCELDRAGANVLPDLTLSFWPKSSYLEFLSGKHCH